MSGARVHGKSTFFWQAVLILLPVAVLAIIGWASLRQDKILAEHDARERAQAVADQLLPTLWNELVMSPDNSSTNRVVFRVDEQGRLAFPPPCESTPVPAPFPVAELSAEQARLWKVSQATTGSVAEAAEACERFIHSNPPKRFAAAAQYQLGLLLLQQDKRMEADEAFDTVARRYPDAVGESGLPLQPLAQFKMIELQPFAIDPAATRFKLNVTPGIGARNGAQPIPDLWTDLKYFVPLDSFCSNIVYHPTLLTPFLLDQAGKLVRPPTNWTRIAAAEAKFSNLAAQTNQWKIVEKWQQVWEEHERAREMFAAAWQHFQVNSFQPLLSVGTNETENPISGPQIFWFALPEHQDNGSATANQGRVLIASDQNWIATRTAGTNGMWFNCRPESDFGFWISTNLEHVPAYFGVAVDVAGKRILAGAPPLRYWHSEYVSGGKGGGQFWEKTDSGNVSTNLLASAARSENGAEQLKVNVYLTSPDELFANQQSRAMLFGLLVIASTVAALIGLYAAWRAFHRQLRLAEMKSNFVSSVSHELRAPIASVRLMAESLDRGKVNEPQKQNEYFRFIVQECRRLSSLIENVLDFSRIEQGRKQYEFEPTDLLALTRETVKLMVPYAEEKGVQLEFETSNIEHRTSNIEQPISNNQHPTSNIQQPTSNIEHPTTNIQHPTSDFELEVDGRAMQQALVNLIDNAIKHSAKGQTVIVGLDCNQRRTGVPPVSDFNVTATDETDTNKSKSETGRMPVLLYVEDCGAGIPPGEHEKIFERFYRLGSELRRETQGVGIGLSIVKHIVEAHGGRVTVRSNTGAGSRFTIELPGKQLNK